MVTGAEAAESTICFLQTIWYC